MCGNRFSLIVRKLVHRFFGEPYAIGLSRAVRGHAAATPPKDRFKLGNGRAVLGCTRRRDFAHAVSRARYAGIATGLAEFVAERLLRERAAAFAGDEGEIAARSGVERRGQRGSIGSVTATVKPLFSVLMLAMRSRT